MSGPRDDVPSDVALYVAGRLGDIFKKNDVIGDSVKAAVSSVIATVGGTELRLDFSQVPKSCADVAAIIYITIVHSHMIRLRPKPKPKAANGAANGAPNGAANAGQKDAAKKDKEKLETMVKYFRTNKMKADASLNAASDDGSNSEQEREPDDFNIITQLSCKESTVAAVKKAPPFTHQQEIVGEYVEQFESLLDKCHGEEYCNLLANVDDDESDGLNKESAKADLSSRRDTLCTDVPAACDRRPVVESDPASRAVAPAAEPAAGIEPAWRRPWGDVAPVSPQMTFVNWGDELDDRSRKAPTTGKAPPAVNGR